MQTQARADLARIFLVILIIAMLIVGSLWTLLPFISAIVWATTIVVATWPTMLNLQRRMGGRRAVATTIMTIAMLAIFIVPFTVAVSILLDAAVESLELVREATCNGLPPPPQWLENIPIVGERIMARWQELAAGGPGLLRDSLRPFARSTASWAMSITGGFGLITLHFLLTVAVTAILYTSGETAAGGVLKFGRRLGRDRGERTVRLAAQALRGVALGVVVTAFVQSLIAGVGLWIAGVPRPGLLLAMVFILSVAQIGALPVMLPAIIWLIWSGQVSLGIVLIAFAVIVMVTDNILKPILIRRGVDLPMLLIIAGVIGGLIGFGVVGLFIGPVLLAVTYTLLDSWMNEEPPETQPPVSATIE